MQILFSGEKYISKPLLPKYISKCLLQVNCLQRRQFICNVKSCFLGKKYFKMSSAEKYFRMSFACKMSPMGTICMQVKSCFLGKIFFKMSSAEKLFQNVFCMQTVSNGDNLHAMPNPVFWEKNISKCLLPKYSPRMLSVNVIRLLYMETL